MGQCEEAGKGDMADYEALNKTVGNLKEQLQDLNLEEKAYTQQASKHLLFYVIFQS